MKAMQTLMLQPWVVSLAWTLIHFVWQGTAVAALYAAARVYALPRLSSPRHRYALACIALAVMVATPLATYFMVGGDTAHQAGPPVSRGVAASPPVVPDDTRVTDIPVIAVSVEPRITPTLPWIVAVWFAGTIAFWFRLLGGWVITARMRSASVYPAPPEWNDRLSRLCGSIGVSGKVRMLSSSFARVPTVIGFLRPVVLVPLGFLAGLPPDQVEAILIHELAHIRRNDYLVNILQSVAEALLFYHPAVWWISGHIRAEREFCCDDVAVSAGGDPFTYASALTELASRGNRSLVGAALAASGGSLTARISRLLDRQSPPRRARPRPGMIVVAIAVTLTAYGLFAQSAKPSDEARPRFEVASVKPCDPNMAPVQRGGGGPTPGRLTLGCLTLRTIIQQAYIIFANGAYNPDAIAMRVPIEGGPSWLDVDRYTIEAKTRVDQAVESNSYILRGPMLQTLLEDRFKVKVHSEVREGPVYELTVAKGGPKLKTFDGGCTPHAMGAPLPPDPAGYCNVSGPGPRPTPGPNMTVRLRGTSLGDVVQILNFQLDRPIVDKTGIVGLFDFDLEFARNQNCNPFQPCAPAMVSDDPNVGPSIFTAVEKQLGLKLSATKGPVELLIVDHAERPSEN